MAYYDHLYIEYQDRLGDYTKIVVQTDGYAGSVLTRDGQATPLTIEWGDSGSTEFTTIYGSTATVRVWADADGELNWLFDANPFKNKLLVYKNGGLYWAGYVDGSQYREQRMPAPKPIEFTATDMLTWVAEKEFDTTITGTDTAQISFIINSIIGLTELNLPLVYSFASGNNLDTDYMLLYKRIDVYEGKTNGDVLNDLLFGSRLTQRQGWWCIIAYHAFTNAGITLTVPATGKMPDDFHAGDFHAGDFHTRISGTNTYYIVPTNTDFWFEGQLIEEYLPAKLKAKYTIHYEPIQNLLRNGDFDTSASWTATSCTLTVISGGIKHANKKLGMLSGTHSYNANPLLLTDYIAQMTAANLQFSSNDLHVRFKFATRAASAFGTAVEMYCMLICTDDVNTYYGYLYYNASRQRISIGWSPTAQLIRLGAKIESGAIAYDDILSGSYDTAYEDLQLFDHYADTIPGTNVILYLYQPNASGPTYQAVYDEVVVRVLETGQNEWAEEVSGVIDLGGDTHAAVDEYDFYVGDFPSSLECKKAVYAHGLFSYTSPYYTSGWRLSSAYSYAEFNYFRLAMMMNLQSTVRRAYQGRLADFYPSLRCVIVDTEASDKKLLENGISYDDASRTVDGQYIELINLPL